MASPHRRKYSPHPNVLCSSITKPKTRVTLRHGYILIENTSKPDLEHLHHSYPMNITKIARECRSCGAFDIIITPIRSLYIPIRSPEDPPHPSIETLYHDLWHKMDKSAAATIRNVLHQKEEGYPPEFKLLQDSLELLVHQDNECIVIQNVPRHDFHKTKVDNRCIIRHVYTDTKNSYNLHIYYWKLKNLVKNTANVFYHKKPSI